MEHFLLVLKNFIKSMLSELKLKTISIDFEQSMIQAIELVFVDVNIQCCYYHLSQSIWRKVQNIGLATKYKENENVHQIVGMLKGLALLPLKYVKKGMSVLYDLSNDLNDPNIDELLLYFDRTYYVNGTYKRLLQNQMVCHYGGLHRYFHLNYGMYIMLQR
ncbi:uncharacterized protein LOC132944409 isoform X1 [Metopolophium dirhodum]|uniref:uncharacterized protein LOC132944409 isoform X1 n=1 Tax=Metopolophium dirhodum TaxID=44670 RepID=UPI00298FDB0F|nr:uncharacterized protein LOC132944409 isoform X1 [Metopolophium dirhodum]